jgi:hypothetical protein
MNLAECLSVALAVRRRFRLRHGLPSDSLRVAAVALIRAVEESATESPPKYFTRSNLGYSLLAARLALLRLVGNQHFPVGCLVCS